MEKELQNYQIARFALSKSYRDIRSQDVDQLKKHLLDAIGSMCNSATKPAIKKLTKQMEEIGDKGKYVVPLTGPLPIDRAAQLLTAMVRYPDFMDNFLGKEATCHPSDNIGCLLAASQYRNISGEEFLAAMAVAYEIECRLVLEVPVMKEGIDHTLMLSYSMIGGLARLLDLSEEQTAHALSIGGCSISPLVTSRASYTYEWKGFASSFTAFNAVNTAMLAKQGMTGPIALFEGPKGFGDIFNMKLKYDWSSDNFDLLHQCVLKSYNSEVHTQTAVECMLDLREKKSFSVSEIEKIDITTFLTAYHITGSGSYGDRQNVETKEQADHSLFYVVAVAALDGEVYPEQFEPERINRADVQELLHKIRVHTKSPLHEPLTVAAMIDPYTIAYPDKMKSKVEVHLKNGEKLTCEKEDFHGFHTRPLSWNSVITKFRRLSDDYLNETEKGKLIEIVRNLENESVRDVLQILSKKGKKK